MKRVLMDKEEWRDIPGVPYQVSNYGRIRRTLSRARGKAGHVLKPCVSNRGYLSVCLSNNGVTKTTPVHRLVCSVFHGNRPTPKHEVAHKDGNSLNNHKDNVRWATKKENEDDKTRHGTRIVGEKHHLAKLNSEKAVLIRSRLRSGERINKLARDLGVSRTTICRVRDGDTWKEFM